MRNKNKSFLKKDIEMCMEDTLNNGVSGIDEIFLQNERKLIRVEGEDMEKVRYNSGSKSKHSEGNDMLKPNCINSFKKGKKFISFKDSKEVAKSSPINRNISGSPIGEFFHSLILAFI
jgi:hypothetical protein